MLNLTLIFINGPMRQGLLWPIEEEGESVR